MRKQKNITIINLSFILLITFLFITFLLIAASDNNHVKDYWNRNLTIPNIPKRIISLSPATTELLCELKLENNIVGITNDCNYPLSIKNKTKTGRFGSYELEKLVKLKPDLIVATSDMGIRLTKLKKIPVPLIALDTPDLDSIPKNIILLGKITKKEKEANNLYQNLKKRIEKIKQRSTKISNKPKVFFYLWDKPLITTGANSFIGDIIKNAGGISITQNLKGSFVHYNIESLIKNNPDVIIIPKTLYKKEIFDKKPWNIINAVKNKKILIIDDDIISRPVPRAIIALEQIYTFLH